jgi:hypothetical protein
VVVVQRPRAPEGLRRIQETYFSLNDQPLTLALAARAPGNSNFEVANHDWELARDLGIRISVQVGIVSASRYLLENEAINGINLVVDAGWMCM